MTLITRMASSYDAAATTYRLASATKASRPRTPDRLAPSPAVMLEIISGMG